VKVLADPLHSLIDYLVQMVQDLTGYITGVVKYEMHWVLEPKSRLAYLPIECLDFMHLN